MPNSTSSGLTNRRPRRLLSIAGCAGFALGVPLVCAVVLVVIYSINNRVPDIRPPYVPVPTDNGYFDFVQAGRMAEKWAAILPAKYLRTPETPANFARFARVAQPAPALVRRGLAKACIIPRLPWETRLRDLRALRQLIRTLVAVSRHYELLGKPRQAADVRLDMAEMAIRLSRGAEFLDALTFRFSEELAISKVTSLIRRLPERDLLLLSTRIDRLTSLRTPYWKVVESEGPSHVAWLSKELREGKDYRTWSAVQELIRSQEEYANAQTVADLVNISQRKTNPPPTWGQRWRTAKFFMANKAMMLQKTADYYKALSAEARRPYTGPSRVVIPDSPLLSTLASQERESFFLEDARWALLRTQIALERYRLSAGAYPEALDQIVPMYLPSVPDDPFGGRDGVKLIYRVASNAKSYTLYSIGPDVRDDNGARMVLSGDLKGPRHTGDLVAGQF
jgi:hypothetical protein